MSNDWIGVKKVDNYSQDEYDLLFFCLGAKKNYSIFFIKV